MTFHQFTTGFPSLALGINHRLKNPIDVALGSLLKKYGLDEIAAYFSLYAKDSLAIKPWAPAGLPPDAFTMDFHTHTAISDGESTYASILRRIGKLGVLDGLLFTDHPWHLGHDGKTRIPNEKVVHKSYDAYETVEALKQKGILPRHFISFPGTVELAPRGTLKYPTKGVEMVAAGLPKGFIEDHGGLRRLRTYLAEDLVDLIHDDGGIAILVHPFYFINASSPELWKKVDAIESFNHTVHVFVEPVTRTVMTKAPGAPLVDELFSLQSIFGYFSWRSRVELERHPRPAVGTSDAHVEQFVGAGCTMFPGPIESLEDLRVAFRHGKTAAIVNPRWEAHVDRGEIIEAIWRHWGIKIAETMIAIALRRRYLLPVIELLAASLGAVQRAHERCIFENEREMKKINEVQ